MQYALTNKSFNRHSPMAQVTMPYPYDGRYYIQAPEMSGGGRKDPFRKVSRGFAKAMSSANPFQSKAFRKFGSDVGKFTNKELLPVVKTVGIPMASAAMGALGTTFGGPMGGIMASQLTDSLLKEYVPGQSKSKYAQMLGDIATMGMTGEVDPQALMSMEQSLLAPPKRKTMPKRQQYDPEYPYQDLIFQLLNTYSQPQLTSQPIVQPSPEPSKITPQQEIINYNALSDALYKDGRLGLGADSLQISAPPFQQREGSMSGLLGSGLKGHDSDTDSEVEGEGVKKKKKRKAKKKTTKKAVKVEIVHKLPYERFQHAENASLRQLLEAQRYREQNNLNRNLEDMTKYIKNDMDNIKNEVKRLEQERDFYKEAGGPLFAGGRLVKGSDAAKERMAKLRAMRKKST